MGCDIHVWTEVRVGGEWLVLNTKTAKLVEANKGKNTEELRKAVEAVDRILDEESDGPEDGDWTGWFAKRDELKFWPDNRDYAMFAVLADVRNDGSIKPIADPRGVPEDASAYYQHQASEWEGDGHSHSWLTARELAAYPWQGAAKALYEGEDEKHGDRFDYILEAISEIQKLATDPDDVRIVFFFDN